MYKNVFGRRAIIFRTSRVSASTIAIKRTTRRLRKTINAVRSSDVFWSSNVAKRLKQTDYTRRPLCGFMIFLKKSEAIEMVKEKTV